MTTDSSKGAKVQQEEAEKASGPTTSWVLTHVATKSTVVVINAVDRLEACQIALAAVGFSVEMEE